MGKETAISWTDHTFNPWWGCEKVSPACANCYAETFSNRLGKKLWGPKATRQAATEKYWGDPLKWDSSAKKAGQRRRVFCASMADVFEDRDDLSGWRSRLFEVIEATPNLDWLLLTKRPENMRDMAPMGWDILGWPKNVWAGTTVENQEWADKRIPHLLKVPARVRFLSVEPMLGRLNIESHVEHRDIDWVICGGESGDRARPMHPDWARELRDQCKTAGVPFHFKQWGQYAPFVEVVNTVTHHIEQRYLGGKMRKVRSKHDSGRLLDGRTWDEFPESQEAAR